MASTPQDWDPVTPTLPPPLRPPKLPLRLSLPACKPCGFPSYIPFLTLPSVQSPGGFYSPGLDPRHPDLVAYYKFDEGAGYVVKDVTGRGHDLSITQSPPGWQVGWEGGGDFRFGEFLRV